MNNLAAVLFLDNKQKPFDCNPNCNQTNEEVKYDNQFTGTEFKRLLARPEPRMSPLN